jgi:hypothetical protein
MIRVPWGKKRMGDLEIIASLGRPRTRLRNEHEI